MNNKFYFRLGYFLGFAGIGIGIVGFIMNYWIGGNRGMLTVINYSLCFLTGLLVIVVNFRSVRNLRMRYLSKQYQVMLLYVTGSVLIINSGDLGGVILFIVGLVLAFRYSFLIRKMLIITGVYNCLLLYLYSLINKVGFIYIIHEIMLIFFTYGVFYLIFRDYGLFLKKRFDTLNSRIDKARKGISYGAQLNKRMAAAELEKVDFTRKEYEVMVALCVYERFSNEELSDFMNISVATVKTHLNNIFGKTGIHSRNRLHAVYKDIFIDRRGDEGRN